MSKNNDTFIEQLETAYDHACHSSEQITYFFDDRSSNPFSNVVVVGINNFASAYHKHDFFEMNYVLDGILHENISGKHFTLTKGQLLIMAPGVFHACVPEESTKSINIILKKEWVAKLSESFKKYDLDNYLTSISDKTIYTLINAGKHEQELTELAQKLDDLMLKLVHHVDLYESLVAENCATEFLLFLTRIPRQEHNFDSKLRGRIEKTTADDIVRYINDNFDKVGLDDTAARFGYSKCQLHRIIKNHTGFTFTELILHMRMQRARHYLVNTHIPIKNIATILGIDSAEHFTRMFKKHRGMTPKEYRNSFMRLSLRKK